jgi:2-alkyl-3-oxoalkanoate reductase
MRAVVTGAGGFAGSALCRALSAQGYDVVALTRRPDATRARIGEGTQRLSIVDGSVADPNQVARAARDAGVIFHAAGLPPGPAPERVLRWLHVAGTENVLRAARYARVPRLVHVSCADVSLTGEDRMHWDEKRALPRAPHGLFAQTKLMAEELALAASDEALKVTAVRPALLWGAGDVDGMARLAQALRDGSFRLYDTGRNVLATTHIDQLVSAALSAAEREDAEARAYYITDGEFFEARELYGKLAGALGLPPPQNSTSLALAVARGKVAEWLGDGGAALADVLRRGRSALFDVSQAVKDLGLETPPAFDARLDALRDWVRDQGGVDGLLKQARPPVSEADVETQVRSAGGD